MITAVLRLVLLALAPVAQSDSLRVTATRRVEPVSIDGVLSEAAWSTALPVTAFVQGHPREEADPTERTEVRVLYDDEALYIGARLYDRAPDSVSAQLARRDRSASSDRFTVYIDAYRDRRTGFFFGVNAAGTLYDGTLYNDERNDFTWDGVWEGSAVRDSLGWAAELRIPFSQLRFRAASEYRWGINFSREVARRGERDYLVYTPKNQSGFVSRFVDLQGIQGVMPPARLEVLPYVTSRAEFLGHEPADPFNDGSRYRAEAGVDVKVGLGEGLTLAATINPDFGQVEVDAAVVNLSEVETFFEERRPLFVEGASIFDFGAGGVNDIWAFNWADPKLLYTRRIGRHPQGDEPNADYSEVPDGTRILAATKLAGKVGDWNLGALNALTGREHGNFSLDGRRWRTELEPLTYYGVYRLQEELAGGRHGLGVIGTAAARAFDAPHLRDALTSNAVALAVDGWTSLDQEREWVVSGWAGLSRVAGTAQRLTGLQESSVHYFQRPDAAHLAVDSAATSLAGFAGRLIVNKQKGDWKFNSHLGIVEPGFEVNDLGFQSRADQINASVTVGHRWPKPSRLLSDFRLDAAAFRNYNFGGDLTWAGYFFGGLYELHNATTGWWTVRYNPRTLSDRRSRGGPLVVNPPGVEWDFRIDSDPNRRWVTGLGLHGYHYASGFEQTWSASPFVEWRPGSRLSLRLEPQFERRRTSAQYVDTFDDPLATRTFGRRYVFADLDQTTLSSSLRLSWIFTPRLSLEVYAQPLLSSGRYSGFKELALARSYEFNRYPDPARTADPGRIIVDPDGPEGAAPAVEIDNPDFSVASLRGNALLRWEYAPGSTLFLVWTQSRAQSEPNGGFDAGRALGQLARAAADNILMLKVSYWWRP